MSHYTMLKKKRPLNNIIVFCLFLQSEISMIQQHFLIVFNKTIIPLALVGNEMIIANSALRASLAIYHLISNARLCHYTPNNRLYKDVLPGRDTGIKRFYYINTNEIPGELSRENMISSHVKITCYLHM